MMLALVWIVMAQVSGEEPGTQVIEYHGIRVTDPNGRIGLRNPERGWRIETLIAELPDARSWGPAAHLRGKLPPQYTDQWWMLDARRYEPYGLTLAQTYCYLDAFNDRLIGEQKLVLLQRNLDKLRASGLKALLRFAYERDTSRRAGPTVETILRHLDQLAPIIRQNADVIFVMQAGFVGAWGEWHSSAHHLEADHDALAAIMAKILEVLPPDRMTQVRVPKYKRWVLRQEVFEDYARVNAQTAHSAIPAARIGFHNDGFLAGQTDGGTWPETPYYGAPGNPEFDLMTEESPYLAVDGELFWADQGGKVDGFEAAVRMRLHHYTSFSLAHSFSEREGKPFSIDDWMHTTFSEEQAREARLPISDGYFQDAQGNPVERSYFEYIRDHLGYRLELQRARFPQHVSSESTFSVAVELINRGFSTLHNPRPVLFVLIDGEEQVTTFPASDADPCTWQPYQPGDASYTPLIHRVEAPISLPDTLEPGWYSLGLWLPDASERLRLDSRYAIRVANRDVPWWTDAAGRHGMNLLGVIQVR